MADVPKNIISRHEFKLGETIFLSNWRTKDGKAFVDEEVILHQIFDFLVNQLSFHYCCRVRV